MTSPFGSPVFDSRASSHGVVVESLFSQGELAPDLIERIDFVTAVAEQLGLDSTPALVRFLVGHLHHMKRVPYSRRPGQRRTEDLAIGTRGIKGGVSHIRASVTVALPDPESRFRAVLLRHDVEGLAVAVAHERCREALAVVAGTAEHLAVTAWWVTCGTWKTHRSRSGRLYTDMGFHDCLRYQRVD